MASRNLLAVPQKTSPIAASATHNHGHAPSLTRALRHHIAANFSDTHPDAFADDLKRIATLRDEVARLECHVASIGAALSYHAQLVFMSTKFPAEINFPFAWAASFPPALPLFPILSSDSPSPPASPEPSSSSSSAPTVRSSIRHTSSGQTVITHADLNYERAAVLFALAALYSNLAASEARSDAESIKRAVAWFQSAAGVLDHILNSIHPSLETLFRSHPRTADPDLTSPMLGALRDLMLAQAQECFWQKAVMDRLKDATIAKLASKVTELYASTLEKASGAVAGEAGSDMSCELPKEWITHITVKRWHFAAAAEFRKSCDDLASNRYGEEIGRLQAAEAHVKRALESSKRASEAIQSDLRSLQGIIANNLKRANKDNDLIYLEAVTPVTRLAPIPSATMVAAKVAPEVANPIPLMKPGAGGLGRPLFQELVPYGVHLALSIYEDRKDTLVREDFVAKREELDAVASSTLQSLNLPGSLQALEQPLGLPSSLLKKSDEVRLAGGVQRLHALASDVRRIADSDAAIVEEARSLLDDEADEDSATRARFSATTWSRESSEVAAAPFRDKLAEYAETLRAARRSDDVVAQKLADWEDAMDVLGQGKSALENFVPSGAASSMPGTEAQTSAARSLRAELERLDDVLDSRASLVAEARALASSDDVRAAVLREAGVLASGPSSGGGGGGGSGGPLVIQAAHFEPLFDDEMRKYDKVREEMERSAAAQEELLEIIRQRNDEFVEARKVDATVRRREKALQTLDLAFSKWREINSNLSEGNKFYNQFARILTDFRQQVKEWRYARQTDVLHLTQMFSGTSLSPRPPPGQAPPSAGAAHLDDQDAAPTGATRTEASGRGVRTRAQAKAAAAAATPPRGAQDPPVEGSSTSTPTKYGAWNGGSIQFGD